MIAADLTPIAAFAAGMATSVHCAAMCGPLSCALLGARGATPAEWRKSAFWYQAARISSYAALGALFGAAGQSMAGLFHAPLSRALPWMLMLCFVAIGLGWERKLPALPLLSRWLGKFCFRMSALPRQQLAGLFGLVTPFLPCGPLYLFFGVALVSGSSRAGLIVMLCFALGTLPFYAAVQLGALHCQRRLSPGAQLWTRRILGFSSAALVGGRALWHDGSLLVPIKCLLCH